MLPEEIERLFSTLSTQVHQNQVIKKKNNEGNIPINKKVV